MTETMNGDTTTPSTTEPPAEPKPTFDPKAVFVEEWTRIVEPQWLGVGIEQAWADVEADDQKGLVVCAAPESAYRMFVRGAAHAWVYAEMKSAAKKHHAQMEAYKTIYTAELTTLSDVCVTLDPGRGVLRKCEHVHNDDDAKAAGAALLAEIIGKVKRTLGVED